ncbi:hypothetical protein RJ639_037913 [Escallonia herrerae]|uniref:Uncharacterized protein n=1 Tax=Escallonia herrerae TaxID=1293975 RepID=A0AA88WMC5_9ASTE|nr:hypothetical protein RJ639_037913 [Escallonia herrerae]
MYNLQLVAAKGIELEHEILEAEYSFITDKVGQFQEKVKSLEASIEMTQKEIENPTEMEVELKRRLGQLTDHLIHKQSQWRNMENNTTMKYACDNLMGRRILAYGRARSRRIGAVDNFFWHLERYFEALDIDDEAEKVQMTMIKKAVLSGDRRRYGDDQPSTAKAKGKHLRQWVAIELRRREPQDLVSAMAIVERLEEFKQDERSRSPRHECGKDGGDGMSKSGSPKATDDERSRDEGRCRHHKGEKKHEEVASRRYCPHKEVVKNVDLRIDGWTRKADLNIIDMDELGVVLGMDLMEKSSTALNTYCGVMMMAGKEGQPEWMILLVSKGGADARKGITVLQLDKGSTLCYGERQMGPRTYAVVEALSSDKAMLVFRIEAVSRLLDENKPSMNDLPSTSSRDATESGVWEFSNSKLRPLLEGRLRSGQKHLGSFVRQLDYIFSAGAIFLRRTPTARMWSFVYLACLHFWVLYILLSHSPVSEEARSGAVVSLENIGNTGLA